MSSKPQQDTAKKPPSQPKPEPGIPQDLTSERTVLAYLQLGGVWPDGLTADDFCRDTHKEIFVALQAIEAAGQARERSSLLIELKQRRKLTSVGGSPYLQDLETEAGIGPNNDISRYVRRLHEYRDRRRGQLIAHTLSEGVRRGGDPEKLAAQAREQLASINMEALEPSIGLLNSLAIFSGKIRFESVNRRGPMTIAQTNAGEIVFPTTADLSSFTKAQHIISDATNIHITPSDYRSIRKPWDAVASLMLKIAASDAQILDHPMREEARENLKLIWRAAGQPSASNNADFIDLVRKVLCSRRDPNGETPPSVFTFEGFCWTHLPTWRRWLFLSKFMNTLYKIPDMRNGLMLLDFVYQENVTRRCEGDSETCCLWKGPMDVLL